MYTDIPSLKQKTATPENYNDTLFVRCEDNVNDTIIDLDVDCFEP